MYNSKYHDLDPSPCILTLTIISFSYKRVSLMVIVNIKVYKRICLYVTMWLMCIYLYYMYICIQMYVCLYMYMYTCKCMSCIYSIFWIHIYMCIFIHTCVYLFGVHLDIVLLVVSDRDDSVKGWIFLFENPGVPPEIPSPPPSTTAMFASYAFLPASSDILLTLGRKNRVFFFGGEKKSWLWNEGNLLIVGDLVTWAIYTQGQLLLWSSLIITGVVPGYK